MKLRVTGSALAGLLAVSLALPAFASTTHDLSSLEVPTSDIYLDGAPAEALEYRLYNGVNYITVHSFVETMQEQAMIEEWNGGVYVSAATVTQVVDVAGSNAQANVVQETLTLGAVRGAPYVIANGRYLYVADGVMTLNGSVAAPIRVLAEVFNLDVGYDGATGNVTLTSQEGAGAYLTSGDQYYDSDVLYWLSRIIYAESGNQPMDGKIAVGNVVMNRVASPLFPDTVYEVIFQRNQFTPAMTGSIHRTPNAASVEAAKMVLDGAVVLSDALFFNAAGLNSYAARTRPYVATIGNHAFYG